MNNTLISFLSEIEIYFLGLFDEIIQKKKKKTKRSNTQLYCKDKSDRQNTVVKN
jgi:hypothetical protein